MKNWMTSLYIAVAVSSAAGTLVARGSPQATQPPQTQTAPGPVPQKPAQFTQLAEDTTVKTSSGATFTVAKGWHVAQQEGLVVLQEPEKELAAAFVEVAAATIDDAIAQAWKRWKPDFSRAVRLTSKPPPTGGWDEVAQTTYEVPAEERRSITAVAFRKGKTHYVALIDGATAARDRRAAQLNTAIATLKVPDLAEENLAGKTPHKLEGARLDTFLAFAEAARKQTNVPGVAIAVIQNGKVVLEKGLGVRELGRPDPVTPDTLFMIGSMTKPITSLLMARLVDQQKFAWNTPVTKLYPAFALGDPEATRQVTMAHTVCACTGLPRWDMEFIFEGSNATAVSRVELLKAMKPTTGFGETFQYNNLMVAAGGYVAALTATGDKELGRAYVAATKAEVLEPVGMRSTVLDLDEAQTREHASPHGRTLRFETERIPTEWERGVNSVMPAGGAWSTVRDISRWLMLELGNGKLDGRPIVSEANLLERRKPRARISAKQAYGLALFVDDSRGLQAIGHGGNTFGFTADATFYPEHGLGLVVLTNAAASNAYTGAVKRRLVELLFDANPEAERNLAFGLKQLAAQIEKQLQEISLTPGSAFVQPLVGAWTNPRLGRIEIRRDGDGYVLDAGEWKSAVGEHKDAAGTRRLVTITPPFVGFAFWPQQEDGRPVLLFETPQQKYLFQRVP